MNWPHIATLLRTNDDLMIIFQQIEKACKAIEDKIDMLSSACGELECVPLYATLSLDAQLRIYGSSPPDKSNGAIGRRVIVSTNIAETSLTIDGIVFVIDPGFANQKVQSSLRVHLFKWDRLKRRMIFSHIDPL